MSFKKRPFDPAESETNREIIREKFASTHDKAAKLNGWLKVDTSRVVRDAHGETWIVFGDTAYKALCGRLEEDGNIIDYMPACLDGEFMAEWPDEGTGGVMHLMTVVARGGVLRDAEPVCGSIDCGWLRASELDLTRREIHEAVANDQALFPPVR